MRLQPPLPRRLVGLKTQLVGAYNPGLSKGLGSTTIDPAWCRYPLGIPPSCYVAHGPSRHLPPPFLCCPCLVQCCPVSCTRVHPLDRVICLSALSTLGLLRTTSCEVAMVLAGFLSAEIQIRQRTVEFYLCQLAYGWNLITAKAQCIGQTHAVSPLDILATEVMRLKRYGDLPPPRFFSALSLASPGQSTRWVFPCPLFLPFSHLPSLSSRSALTSLISWLRAPLGLHMMVQWMAPGAVLQQFCLLG